MEELLPGSNSTRTNHMLPVLDKVIQFSLFSFAAFCMFSISITQISFALGALASLLKAHLTKSWNELRGTYVGIAILCFCLACVLSIITSVDLGSSLKLLKKILQFIILFWVANAVQSAKQRDLLIKLLIVAGVAAALNGLLPLFEPSLFSSERLYGGSRPMGTMGAPSTFSGILMIVGLATFGRFLFHKPKEYWVFGGLGVIGLCLLLTFTRQAWLGFFIGAVYLILFWNKNYLLLIPLILAGLLLFGSEGIKDRLHSFSDIKDGAFMQRASTWKGALQIFKDYPTTGCGYKCVDFINSQYPDPSGNIALFRGMHNNFFQLLVDTGFVGLATWILIWAAYFLEIFKRWYALDRESSLDNAWILMGCSAAVLAYLVGGFFESTVYDSEVSMLIYFLMGISLTKVKNVELSRL